MYIYESHLGALYSSDYKLDYDSLYCEQCGDSDWEIGEFSSPEELWKVIKPFDLVCYKCKKESNDCMETCKLIEDSHGYSFDIKYCMEFLLDTFDIKKKRFVYLVAEDKESGRVFADFKPTGHEFGEFTTVPKSFCLLPELEEHVALSLIPYVEIVEKPKKIKTINIKGNTVSVYKCIVNRDKEDNLDSAWHWDDSWYGWAKEFKALPEEKFLEELCLKNIHF